MDSSARPASAKTSLDDLSAEDRDELASVVRALAKQVRDLERRLARLERGAGRLM